MVHKNSSIHSYTGHLRDALYERLPNTSRGDRHSIHLLFRSSQRQLTSQNNSTLTMACNWLWLAAGFRVLVAMAVPAHGCGRCRAGYCKPRLISLAPCSLVWGHPKKAKSLIISQYRFPRVAQT